MNIWTGLLFLEGAVADARLARELAREADDASAEPAAPAATTAARDGAATAPLVQAH